MADDKMCSAAHPVSLHECCEPKGHTSKHRNWYHETWSTPGQVSGDDRWNARDEELRELLSHCRAKADGPTESGMYGDNAVYDEIANRLANILDGEGE